MNSSDTGTPAGSPSNWCPTSRPFFGWEGEPPTKIDYSKKCTLLEDLVEAEVFHSSSKPLVLGNIFCNAEMCQASPYHFWFVTG